MHPGYLSARVDPRTRPPRAQSSRHAQAELEHVLASAPENLAAIRGLAEIAHRTGNLTAALGAVSRRARARAERSRSTGNGPTISRRRSSRRPVRRSQTACRWSRSRRNCFSAIRCRRRRTLRQSISSAARCLPFPRLPTTILRRRHRPRIWPFRRQSTPSPHPRSIRSHRPRDSPVPWSRCSTRRSRPIRIRTIHARWRTPSAEAPPGLDERLDSPERRTIAALEQWLDAIHVTRDPATRLAADIRPSDRRWLTAGSTRSSSRRCRTSLYLTNFTGSAAIVVLTARRLHFITDFRYVTVVSAMRRTAHECPDLELVVVEGSYDAHAGGAARRAAASRRVGFEAAHLTVSRYDWLERRSRPRSRCPRAVACDGADRRARARA